MADNTLRIAINADIRGLNQNLNKAQGRLKAFSGRLKNIGGQLQTRLALPLVAAGGASIKMAADFDKSMTKIKTLVGVAGAEVDQMSMGVKAMATNAGVSSGEAADALFYITSAGLRGADAMAVLEQSTKAAALGLGDTATVADLATSALNAYGVENLSATDATDVLTGAVREGKLEASELSSVMGQVLPVASNMGVEFHEVGAAFAAMSRTGTPAAQAATQLNSILMAIMKPTKQSAAAMAELGLSSQGLREQIKDKGLLSVFETLKTKSLDNSEAFERVFGNVRALKGIMDLTGASAATTAEIFDRMSNTTGMTSKAFVELQKSSEFRLRKGLKSLQNSFTDLGAVLMDSFMPLIQNIMGFFQGLFKAFSNLDPATQQIVIGLAAFAAVLPTIISLGGTLLGIISALVSPIGLVAAGVAAVAYIIYKNWNEVLPVIVGLYNRFVDLYNGSENLRIGAGLIKTAFQVAFIKIKQSIDQVINVFKTMWNLIKEVSERGVNGAFGDILEKGFKDSVDITKKAGQEIGEVFSENMAAAVANRLEYKTTEQVNTALSNVVTKAQDLIQSNLKSFGISQPKAVNQQTTASNQTSTSSAGKKLAEETKVIETEGRRMISITDEMMEEVDSIVSGGLQDVTIGIANAMSAAISSGASFSEGLKIALLGGVASVAEQLGKLAIGVGIAVEGISKALKSLSGPVAIAAGIALLVVAGVAKGAMAKMSEKAGGGTVPKFANGGIVSGPTLGLMGEYSGARSNPEVIAPLDKLKGMIGQQGQTVHVGGEFRLQGQDLVVALQRAEKNRSRLL